MLTGMLGPVGIVHPDGISGFVVLLLQGFKEIAHDPFRSPGGEAPYEEGNDEKRDNGRGNGHLLSPGFFGIVLLRVEQRHMSSITDTTGKLKVPGTNRFPIARNSGERHGAPARVFAATFRKKLAGIEADRLLTQGCGGLLRLDEVRRDFQGLIIGGESFGATATLGESAPQREVSLRGGLEFD